MRVDLFCKQELNLNSSCLNICKLQLMGMR